MGKKKKHNSLESEETQQTYPKGHQIKKLSKGTVFNTTSKIIILNVYKYFRTKGFDVNVSEAVRLTVEATGCSPTSVYQLRKEESSKEGLREPSKKRIRKGIHKLSRDLKYDDSVRTAIRNIVQELRSKDAIPSLATILEHIKSTNGMGNEQLQSMAPWTLRRLIFDLGFVYKKDGNKKILIDKEMEKKIKKPRVRKRDPAQEKLQLICTEPEPIITPLQNNPNTIAINDFTPSQYMERNEYMLFEPIKTNNVIIQLQHQSQLSQGANSQNQMCNNLMVQMPTPIISTNINQRNIQLLSSNNDLVNNLSSPKLMVLTTQPSVSWS